MVDDVHVALRLGRGLVDGRQTDGVDSELFQVV